MGARHKQQRRATKVEMQCKTQTHVHGWMQYTPNGQYGGSVQRPGLVLLDEIRRLLNPDRHPLLTVI